MFPPVSENVNTMHEETYDLLLSAQFRDISQSSEAPPKPGKIQTSGRRNREPTL